jgi:hypothetical protein
MVEIAVNAMRGDIRGMSREYAHGWLADRFFGKAKQQIDVSGHVGITEEHLVQVEALQLSPHERRDRIAELRQRSIRSLPEPDLDPEPIVNGHAVDD